MKDITKRIKKLENDNRGKYRLAELVANCQKMVKDLIENPRPNRKLEDFMDDED